MVNCNRLSTTLALICAALRPDPSATAAAAPVAAETTAVQSAAFRSVLGNPAALLTPDGRLRLLFTGAGAAAAPFLLFRLKRQGYSACRVQATDAGLLLTASR